MRFVVVSSNLNPKNTNLILARAAEEKLKSMGHESDLMDLCEHALPLCGGPDSFSHPLVARLSERFERGDGFLLSSPVYNYDVNAALKNLVELTGQAWADKPVGFLLSAGGHASYMSPLGLANSLMLDFRCLILPRFVYALGKQHFNDGRVSDPDIQRRVEELAVQLVRVAGALKKHDNA